jgi:hypothetical protein
MLDCGGEGHGSAAHRTEVDVCGRDKRLQRGRGVMVEQVRQT